MKKIMTALIIIASIVAATLSPAQVAFAADPTAGNGSCTSHFLGLRAWYDGLADGNCNVPSPKDDSEVKTYIWTIALNVISMIL
jgi:hypothetical protein